MRPDTFTAQALPLWDQLYRFAHSWTHSREDAEDAVQDTYARAYKSLHTFKEGTNLLAWMHRILRNVLITNWRKRTPELFIDPDDMSEQRLVWGLGTVDVEQQVMEQLDLSPVGTALDTLTPAHQAILHAASMYSHDRTMHGDLAQQFGTTTGTIGSRLSRARVNAKAALADLALAE